MSGREEVQVELRATVVLGHWSQGFGWRRRTVRLAPQGQSLGALLVRAEEPDVLEVKRVDPRPGRHNYVDTGQRYRLGEEQEALEYLVALHLLDGAQ